MELPTVRLDQRLGKRQAEPRAAGFARPRLISAVEAVEDPRQALGPDARTRVCHLEQRVLAVPSQTDIYPATRRGVLDRVVDDDQQHLLQSVGVRLDDRRLRL